MYNKTCKICGVAFESTGPAGMYCQEHAEQKREEARLRAYKKTVQKRIATGVLKKPGVGKGGNPRKGQDHPSYKHGLYVFERLRTEIKAEIRYCERCSKDLLGATQHHWVVHHKDHNHWNHERSNLELLCKRCHQLEHECHKNFGEGATTRA